jgi:steroid delta-isomerase-like uncharacterized protein
MATRTPQELIDAFYAAYDARDPAAAAALYAEDGEHREIAQSSVRTGRAQIAEGLGRFLEAFPDARWRVRNSLLNGARAAVAYELTGTLSTQLGPFEPRGQRLSLLGLHLFELRCGEIGSTEDYWDSGSFARQMR